MASVHAVGVQSGVTFGGTGRTNQNAIATDASPAPELAPFTFRSGRSASSCSFLGFAAWASALGAMPAPASASATAATTRDRSLMLKLGIGRRDQLSEPC